MMRKQRSSGSIKSWERRGNEWKNMDEEKLGYFMGQTVSKGVLEWWDHNEEEEGYEERMSMTEFHRL